MTRSGEFSCFWGLLEEIRNESERDEKFFVLVDAISDDGRGLIDISGTGRGERDGVSIEFDDGNVAAVSVLSLCTTSIME